MFSFVTQAILFWRNAPAFLKAFNQMAAIGKAGDLTDVGEIKIREQKKLFYLVNTHVLNVFLAAFSVDFLKTFGKIGVAQSAVGCNITYLQFVVEVSRNIWQNIIDVIVILYGIHGGIKAEAVLLPVANNNNQQLENL